MARATPATTCSDSLAPATRVIGSIASDDAGEQTILRRVWAVPNPRTLGGARRELRDLTAQINRLESRLAAVLREAYEMKTDMTENIRSKLTEIADLGAGIRSRDLEIADLRASLASRFLEIADLKGDVAAKQHEIEIAEQAYATSLDRGRDRVQALRALLDRATDIIATP